MTRVAKFLAGCPQPIVLPELRPGAEMVVRAAGFAQMDVGGASEFGVVDLDSIVVANWMRSARARRK